MKFKLDLPDILRHGKDIYQPGIYRVPEDLSEELAEKAIRDLGAKRIDPAKKVFPQRGRKKLGAAPENKSFGASPEHPETLE